MEAPPEQAGIDSRRLNVALDVLRRGVDEGAMPGCVVRASRAGRTFLHEAIGSLDGSRPAGLDTIYDLASLTKPIATGASLLVLVERGRVALNATLPLFFPNVPDALAPVTLNHLLTHTSGLPAHHRLWESRSGRVSSADPVETILRLPPTAPPGTRYEYSCLGFILLGRIIEQITGKPLDAFARAAVFGALGLADTTYRPGAPLHSRIAATRSQELAQPGDAPDRDLIGIVHDGNARHRGGVSGNAGLFGTAADVHQFGLSLLRGGRDAASAPHGLFSAATIRRVLVPQTQAPLSHHTFLFFSHPNPLNPAGDLLSPAAVGHSGYTGTALVIDPTYELVVALCANRVYTDPTGAKWLPARRQFLNALAAAITS